MQYSFLLLFILILIFFTAIFIIIFVIIKYGWNSNYLLICSLLLNSLFIILGYIINKKGYSAKCKDFPIHKKILFSNLLKNVKTGDLLLFSNGRCNVITRTFGNPYYSHIGIIVNKNNKFYSLELVKNDMVYPKQDKYKNMILIPLEDRITNYSGQVFHCSLINKLSNENETKLNNYHLKNIKYSLNYSCGSFIAKLLENIQIANNLDSPYIWDIHNNIINLCNNTIYTNPINIIADKLVINNINENSLMNYC